MMRQIKLYIIVLSVLYLSFTSNGQGQTADAIRMLQGGEVGQCPSVEERESARNEIRQSISSVIATLGATTTTAPMTSTYTCNGTPGWRRVAFINMTDTSYNCPTGLSLTSYSKRTCGRSHTTDGGCSSTTFSVGGLPYSRVCGRIRAYQFGVVDAFVRGGTQGINSFYVDGVSLTHGAAGRRQHIWTFAAGLTEVNNTNYLYIKCPCDISRNYDRVPAFVGNDYFCESGVHSPWTYKFTFYPNDVLWDGQNCTSTSTCCQLNNPPWFTKNLPTATTDDIELRLCTHQGPTLEDIPIELIELYIQ